MNQGDLKRKNFRGRSFDDHEDVSRDSIVENFDQNDSGGVEVEEPSTKKHNSSPLETTTVVLPSSFDFHVFEKEGINVHVDLNSSPSDYWNGRIKNELSRGENVRRIGSRSLLQDLGFLTDSSTQRRRSLVQNGNSNPTNDHNGQTNSCTSLEVPKDDLAWFDQQEEDDSSIMSAPLVPRSMAVNVANSLKKGQLAVSAELTVTVADNLKEYQSTAAAELTATVADNLKENQSTASANLNANAIDNLKEHQSIASAELTANIGNNLKEDQSSPSAELTANVADNLKEDQSTVSAELSYGVPKLFVSGSESCAKNEFKKILDSKATSTPLIKSLYGSVELQITDVASCGKNTSVSLGENDDSVDLVDLKKSSDAERDGLVNSSELNLDNDGNNFPSIKDERGTGKIVNSRKSSKCSQFHDPLKKSGPDSLYRKSRLELQRKRKQVNSQDQGSSGSPFARILRSMKHIAGEGLPRRSMRLISK